MKIETMPVKSSALAEIIREQEEAHRAQCDRVRQGLLDAIALFADAALHPLIARSTIERAHAFVQAAYKAARELDPPFEESDYGKDDEYHAPHGAVTNHDLTDDQRADMPRTL